MPAVAYCRLLSSSDTMPSNATVSKAFDAQAGRRQTCRRRDAFEIPGCFDESFEQARYPIALSNHDSAAEVVC